MAQFEASLRKHTDTMKPLRCVMFICAKLEGQSVVNNDDEWQALAWAHTLQKLQKNAQSWHISQRFEKKGGKIALDEVSGSRPAAEERLRLQAWALKLLLATIYEAALWSSCLSMCALGVFRPDSMQEATRTSPTHPALPWRSCKPIAEHQALQRKPMLGGTLPLYHLFTIPSKVRTKLLG